MVDFLLPPSGSRRGTIPTQTLVDALTGEIGGTPQFLVLDSIAEEEAGNRYITWASLYADLVAARAAGVHGAIIIVHSNNSTPAVIPEGTYDLSGVIFLGEEAGYETGFARLNITDAVISVPPILFDGLSLAFTGAANIGGGYKLTFRDCYVAAQDNPITDEAYVVFESTTVDGSSSPLLYTNTTIEVVLRNSCLGDGSLGGDGAYNVALFDLASIVGTMTGPTVNKLAPSYPGGLSANYDDANVALDGAPRFGPWRHSAAQTSNGGTYAASERERVLLGVGAITFTVHFPLNAPVGARVALKSLLAGGGGSGLVTLTFASATSDVIEDASTMGTTSASVSWIHGSAGGEAIEYERFPDGAWRIVSRVGS